MRAEWLALAHLGASIMRGSRNVIIIFWRHNYMQIYSPQSIGGKIMAIRQRHAALSLYYQNPNKCKRCGEIIHPGDKKVSEIRKKKFCNHTCAALVRNIVDQRKI